MRSPPLSISTEPGVLPSPHAPCVRAEDEDGGKDAGG